jgi:hypothetical protein
MPLIGLLPLYIQIIFDNGDSLSGVQSRHVLNEIQVIERFPFTKQGLQLRHLLDCHELLGKGFKREWVNMHGHRREVYGTITKCWKGLVDAKAKFFTVEYYDSLVQLHESIPAADDNVSEASAWGGYVAFEQEKSLSQVITPEPPFHWNWIVPATPIVVKGTPYPALVVLIRGFELRFVVKKSSIPNSGLGLWVVCSRVSPFVAHLTEFVLPPGDLLDLAVYGPLRNEDLKSESIFVLKDFIHLGSAKSWSFERASHESGYIDMTNDRTGGLHELASKNIISYANETNKKKETPSICSLYDPTGAIHYLLGHNYACYGPLTIPVGKLTELKVSYFMFYWFKF